MRFRVLIDWDDDGVFSAPGDEITEAVLELGWRLGAVTAGQRAAPPGYAEITLENRDHRFSPERSALALKPGKALRIVREQGEALIPHFTGQISAIWAEPGGFSGQKARITAQTVDAQLDGFDAALPPLPETEAGEALALLLDRLPLRREGLAQLWALGVTGYSALDSETRLADSMTAARQFDAGITRLRYPGALWRDGMTAAEAVRDLVATERGRFYADRQGWLRFENRHQALRRVPPSAVFDETMDVLDYSCGEGVISRVRVQIRPCAIGSDDTVLWTLSAPQRLMPGMHLIRVHFRDAEGEAAGAAAIAGVTTVANSEADGSGSAQPVTTIVRRLEGSAAEIEFRNLTDAPVWLLAGTQIIGTPIQPLPPLSLEQADLTSATFYGGGTLLLDLPLLDSIDAGEQTARFELARRRQPQGIARSVRFSRFRAPAALDVTIGDRIRLADSQTGHDQTYIVTGEAHALAQGGAQHSITLILEAADPQVFWCLDASALGMESALAY